MGSYPDLRALLAALEERGKLYRFTAPVDKDRELFPLYRVQLQGLPEAERKVFLFEDVRGARGNRYAMPVVAGVYGVTEEVLALGIGCAAREEMLERWHTALEQPLPPVIVADGPVQEVVHVGDDLEACGLDELPAPLEEPGFSQVIRAGLPMITRDLESGILNVGTYTAFFRDRTRGVAGIGPPQHAMRHHWQAARRRGEDLPVAIVVGPTPALMLAASAPVPYGLDELAVAGALAGEPLPLVRCQTVPLEVPATAEIVIEGFISTRLVEPRLGFGEYPGYLNLDPIKRPVLQVTAITHRRDALFTPVLVGFPPTDTTHLTGFANAAMLYHSLRYTLGFPVEDVYLPKLAGGADWCVVSPATRGARRRRGAARRDHRTARRQPGEVCRRRGPRRRCARLGPADLGAELPRAAGRGHRGAGRTHGGDGPLGRRARERRAAAGANRRHAQRPVPPRGPAAARLHGAGAGDLARAAGAARAAPARSLARLHARRLERAGPGAGRPDARRRLPRRGTDQRGGTGDGGVRRLTRGAA
jgi:UbiD family decarboxylase